MENLKGLKVAILVTDGFEQVELLEPRKALDQAGAETRVVSPKDQRVKAWKFTDWGRGDTGRCATGQSLFAQLRRAAAARRRHEPRRSTDNSEGGRIHKGVLRRRQAGRRYLPRPMDSD